MHSPYTLELGHSKQSQGPLHKKRHVNKVFGSFLSKLDGEMLPLGSEFWRK